MLRQVPEVQVLVFLAGDPNRLLATSSPRTRWLHDLRMLSHQVMFLLQVFLVGDPNQLPATVISKDALGCGYDVSLFQRLQAAGHPVQARFNAPPVTSSRTLLEFQ